MSDTTKDDGGSALRRCGVSFGERQVTRPADELRAEIAGWKALPVTLPTPARVAMPLVQGERVVFTEQGELGQQIKLVASGPLDEFMLDALENYIERQKRRLKRPEETN